MSEYKVTTTSVDVDLRDLGLKTIIHPTTSLDLIAEHGCNVLELLNSKDLLDAIGGGFLTIEKVNVQTPDELKAEITATINGLSGYAERFEKSGSYRNQYLKYGTISLNSAPYVIAKNATITNIFTIESQGVEFDIEIKINGSLVSTLTWQTTDPVEKSGLSIPVNAGDELKVYVRTNNGNVKVKNLASQFFFKTDVI